MQTFPPVHHDRSQGMSYQRLLPLGSGGMANVHLALALGQSGFKRLVVVKSVREELLANPAMRQMFLAEARLSARLNHPNVVQVSEVVETPEGVMLVMEYLDGLSLAATYRTAGDAFSLPMRLRVICEALAGLHYAHDLVDYEGNPLGIVHRDVSPQNVFLTFDGRVKLLDFGIAKVTSAPDRTRTGVIKGRIAYMPVEQVTGKPVDRRTDVFAIGCLLWEAIAGGRMWEKLPDPQIVRNVLKGNVPRLGSRVHVDPELERIVTKATAHAAEDRFATAEELRLELEEHLSALPPINLREVGELLSDVCRSARVERQRELSDAIAVAERDFASSAIKLTEGESQEPAWATHTETESSKSALMTDRARSGSGSKTGASSSRMVAVRTPAPGELRADSASMLRQLESSRRRPWLPLGLAATLLGGAAVWAYLRPSAPLPAPAATLALPTPDGLRVLTIEAKPADARVLVDDQLASGSPVVLRVAAARPHLVRVEREGYRSSERSVLVETDTSLSIELSPDDTEPLATGASASAAPVKTPRGRARAPVVAAPVQAAKPSTAAPTANARAGCSPPYYFSAGIKTYKPECI